MNATGTPFRLALLPSILVIACSDSSPTDTDDGDSIRPTVAAATPLANATGVAIGTTLTVTFSESVDPATVTATTFTVSGPVGPVAGTVTVVGTVATFTPNAPLTELTSSHTATVTTGVRDLAGNALATDFSWQFTTELVSPLYWYRLSNHFLGDGRSLDTSNDAQNLCVMGDTDAFTGQYWQFTPLPSIGPGLYRLTNRFRGVTLSLEGGDGSDACSLDPSGNFTGQFWTLTPNTGQPGYFKLRTQYQGTTRSLDTANTTDVPYLAVTGPFSGQNWKVRRIERI